MEARLAAINRDTPKGSSPAATSEGTAVDQEVESLTKDFGILKIEPDGRTIWHGSSRLPRVDIPLIYISASHAPSDNFLLDNAADDSASLDSGLPIELLMLATSFPFTPINPSQCPSKFQGIKDVMKALAPPYDITLQVIDAFYNHTTWLGTPVPRSEVLEETALPLYRISSWENVPAPRLAFFFSVVAVGVLGQLFDGACDRLLSYPILSRHNTPCVRSTCVQDAPTCICLPHIGATHGGTHPALAANYSDIPICPATHGYSRSREPLLGDEWHGFSDGSCGRCAILCYCGLLTLILAWNTS